jgi:hypothetical protein
VRLNPGDHICAIYSTENELAAIVSEFLADGLRRSERCWYLPAGDASDTVRASLEGRGVNTARALSDGALRILSANAAYNVRGDFEPEETMAVFSSAIEQALSDGFSGFRAAANMSWALNLENGVERLITYEALLRSLFATARATGLCLYDRSRMPLPVIDGALCTHPIERREGAYRLNPFYDDTVDSLEAANRKMTQIDTPPLDRQKGSRGRPRPTAERKR